MLSIGQYFGFIPLGVELSHDPLYVLREEVKFRCFPDSTVAFHPDTGDTLVLDNICGYILQALLGSTSPLCCAEIDLKTRTLDPSSPIEDPSAIEDRLAALELHDLVRTVSL